MFLCHRVKTTDTFLDRHSVVTLQVYSPSDCSLSSVFSSVSKGTGSARDTENHILKYESPESWRTLSDGPWLILVIKVRCRISCTQCQVSVEPMGTWSMGDLVGSGSSYFLDNTVSWYRTAYESHFGQGSYYFPFLKLGIKIQKDKFSFSDYLDFPTSHNGVSQRSGGGELAQMEKTWYVFPSNPLVKISWVEITLVGGKKGEKYKEHQISDFPRPD